MGMTIAQKILKAHLVDGEMVVGQEIGLRIDQTLTQDATGTMAYLQFEAMGVDQVKTERSVAYIDHNTLQSGFENADDHKYIGSVAKKHGIYYSKAGNGICHQVHLERFGKPGKTLIGSDSHTPTGGGIGMLAFGAGGMDVAVAMGGGAYYITMPKMFKVNLTGTLRPFVTAKDISLELLRILSVKGGVGAIIEWGGPGIAALSVPERATITNMGTELGATTSIFPSDETTRAFLAAQASTGRALMSSKVMVEYRAKRRYSGATFPVRFEKRHGGSARMVQKPPSTRGSGGNKKAASAAADNCISGCIGTVFFGVLPAVSIQSGPGPGNSIPGILKSS